MIVRFVVFCEEQEWNYTNVRLPLWHPSGYCSSVKPGAGLLSRSMVVCPVIRLALIKMPYLRVDGACNVLLAVIRSSTLAYLQNIAVH